MPTYCPGGRQYRRDERDYRGCCVYDVAIDFIIVVDDAFIVVHGAIIPVVDVLASSPSSSSSSKSWCGWCDVIAINIVVVTIAHVNLFASPSSSPSSKGRCGWCDDIVITVDAIIIDNVIVVLDAVVVEEVVVQER